MAAKVDPNTFVCYQESRLQLFTTVSNIETETETFTWVSKVETESSNLGSQKLRPQFKKELLFRLTRTVVDVQSP